MAGASGRAGRGVGRSEKDVDKALDEVVADPDLDAADTDLDAAESDLDAAELLTIEYEARCCAACLPGPHVSRHRSGA
jgi:hypothetical protein